MNAIEINEALSKALVDMSAAASVHGAAAVGNAHTLWYRWADMGPEARMFHFAELQNALARLNSAYTTLGFAMSAAETANEREAA